MTYLLTAERESRSSRAASEKLPCATTFVNARMLASLSIARPSPASARLQSSASCYAIVDKSATQRSRFSGLSLYDAGAYPSGAAITVRHREHPMIAVRPAEERGIANFGWLDSRHSFSFGHYYDPKHMGFGPLRVINEDRVRPGAGFDTHGHRDMEIISYVLEGALEHKDSIGTGSVIRPGDVQRMSAGTGIRHSEYNHSTGKPVHFLQIWVLPDAQGLKPRYDQKTFPGAEKRGRLRLVGSPDGRDGSIVIHQDADIYASLLDSGEAVTHVL